MPRAGPPGGPATGEEADGRFRLAGLNPGRYELKAELQGFGAVTVPDITVAVGSETTRNVTMQVQGLQESVTVTGSVLGSDLASVESVMFEWKTPDPQMY